MDHKTNGGRTGAIMFRCGESRLEAGFQWAKEQALHYVHDQGAAGPWYEAALPGRNACCMRDVSHQAAGAHFLGLDAHNKNMLRRFAQSMAESRDYCCFWEITGDGRPAPEDYVDDRDFWYNLPANYDVLDACWRMYCLTGDGDYRDDPDFQAFYDHTVKEYTAVWDHDGDGVPDRDLQGIHRRGIPSYDERKGMEEMSVAADLIAAQYRGYRSYAQLRGLTGAGAAEWEEKAEQLAGLLATKWYDKAERRFYGTMDRAGKMFPALGSPHLLAYFDAVRDEEQRLTLLDQIDAIGRAGIIVELMSHYPEIFFRHGQPDRGLYWLEQLLDPSLPRREYPEVSFAAVGAYVTGLMGISGDAASRTLYTSGQLPAAVGAASLENCPLFGGTIDLTYQDRSVRLRNCTGAPLRWRGMCVADGETAESAAG
ncbi:MAG: hypothetical protein HDT14_07835 [Oscillibacter sp.]|nr:hypothetical protein [Oscillibacter sp.]